MEIQRGVTTRRIFANLLGYATKPIMIGGVVHSSKTLMKDHVETGGAYTNAPAVSYYQLKRTQQNDNGDVLIVYGTVDVTYFSKLFAALSFNSTCASQYMAVGLYPADQGMACPRTSGQHIKDIKTGVVLVKETTGASIALDSWYADISACTGEYYVFAECWAQDAASSSNYAELALRTLIFEV